MNISILRRLAEDSHLPVHSSLKRLFEHAEAFAALENSGIVRHPAGQPINTSSGPITLEHDLLFLDKNGEKRPILVERQFGIGKTGTDVFSGYDLEDGTRVVIKRVLKQEAGKAYSMQSQEFARECVVLTELNRFHGAAETDEHYYVTDELIQGQDIHKKIQAILKKVQEGDRNEQPDNFIEAVNIMYQMIRPVRNFHAEGFIHRDIKPHNIIVGAGLVCRLIDFGSSDKDDTPTGDHNGTNGFLAPEIENCQDTHLPFTQSSDVYAMGESFKIILDCFESKHTLKLLTRRNDDIKEAAAGIQELIKSMKSDDPTQRPTAAEAEAKLHYILSNAKLLRVDPVQELITSKKNKETDSQSLRSSGNRFAMFPSGGGAASSTTSIGNCHRQASLGEAFLQNRDKASVTPSPVSLMTPQ